MEDKAICPLCGEGHITPLTEDVETEYHGQKGLVAYHYSECDACGSEITNGADSRTNKRAVLRFRKQVDGLLTGDEIRAIRKQYHLTQEQAAKLFGGGPVAFSKYENDDVAHSEAMDNLLRLVRRSNDAFWELVDEKQMAELQHRRQKLAQFNSFRELMPTFVIIREQETAPLRTTKRFDYLVEPRSTSLKPEEWMQ